MSSVKANPFIWEPQQQKNHDGWTVIPDHKSQNGKQLNATLLQFFCSAFLFFFLVNVLFFTSWLKWWIRVTRKEIINHCLLALATLSVLYSAEWLDSGQGAWLFLQIPQKHTNGRNCDVLWDSLRAIILKHTMFCRPIQT